MSIFCFGGENHQLFWPQTSLSPSRPTAWSPGSSQCIFGLKFSCFGLKFWHFLSKKPLGRGKFFKENELFWPFFWSLTWKTGHRRPWEGCEDVLGWFLKLSDFKIFNKLTSSHGNSQISTERGECSKSVHFQFLWKVSLIHFCEKSVWNNFCKKSVSVKNQFSTISVKNQFWIISVKFQFSTISVKTKVLFKLKKLPVKFSIFLVSLLNKFDRHFLEQRIWCQKLEYDTEILSHLVNQFNSVWWKIFHLRKWSETRFE